MFDTLHLWLPMSMVGKYNLSVASKYVSNVMKQEYENGQVIHKGILGSNIRVNVSERGVSLQGSLAKYFLGNNFQNLTKSYTIQALQKMADELCLSVDKAIVRRFDLGGNIITQHKPEAYFFYLGLCGQYERWQRRHSLYFEHSSRKLLFYNKFLESKRTGMIIPQGFNDVNVLRYEIAFLRRLPLQFNLPEVTARILTGDKFYMELGNRWQAEYKAINKRKSINLNPNAMKSPKDFKKQLLLRAIQMIGQDELLQEVENLRARGAFASPEYYSRVKREIILIGNNTDECYIPELVEELNEKINEVRRNWD